MIVVIKDMNILEYVETTAKNNPQKTAFAYGECKYTFSEATKIARSLAVLVPSNIKNQPILVFAERSADTLIYFLAVLYSGNFYVPIDPGLPDEKLDNIMSDCNAGIAFGNEGIMNTRIVNSCVIYSIKDQKEEMCLLPDLSENSPLYMVYTSGSTGKPKGVLKTHGAVISFIEAYVDTFRFDGNEVIGNQTPFFFDASAKDIYLTLRTGATLEIIPTEKFALMTELIEYLDEKRISFISWVPTVLSMVAQMRVLDYVKPTYLKRVFFVGEVMPVKYLNVWIDALPGVQFVNLYGQSELAGICCYYIVNAKREDSDVLPIGKTLSNCKIYLDNNEIIISSPALAAGYYNDPEATNLAFYIHDYGDGPVRCFRTGDLAFINESGDYVFKTRSDFQIKHLGHRIELGEIETVASALDEIKNCACIYDAGKQSIILFAETCDESITSKTIKRLLKQKLLTYMVPERIKIIDKIPLNANGKIHRTKLKEMI